MIVSLSYFSKRSRHTDSSKSSSARTPSANALVISCSRHLSPSLSKSVLGSLPSPAPTPSRLLLMLRRFFVPFVSYQASFASGLLPDGTNDTSRRCPSSMSYSQSLSHHRCDRGYAHMVSEALPVPNRSLLSMRQVSLPPLITYRTRIIILALDTTDKLVHLHVIGCACRYHVTSKSRLLLASQSRHTHRRLTSTYLVGNTLTEWVKHERALPPVHQHRIVASTSFPSCRTKVTVSLCAELIAKSNCISSVGD